MTEKKHYKHKRRSLNETQAGATELPENAEQANAEMEALMKRLEESEAKVAEHLDGWQRSQADFINYKNRVQRDQELMKSVMKGDIIKKFLPVLDDLEHALQNRPANLKSSMGGIE